MTANHSELINSYIEKLQICLNSESMKGVIKLSRAMKNAWESKKNIYICGNGGSAGNANHLANDFTYGVGLNAGIGMRIEALSSNPSVLTCLANDIGYENIFSEQIRVKGNEEDLLIVLSGSGNSQNIINAIEMANSMNMSNFAILGYDGGKSKKIAKEVIHFNVNDMQVSEDMQLIVGHICMQWLCNN